MTRKEYDALPSNGQYACPDCGFHTTVPYPGCGCRDHGGYTHINKWHHDCEYAKNMLDETVAGNTGISTKKLLRLLKKHDFIDVENKGFKRMWND